MSKVTSKLQVTFPKALAAQYGIQSGSEITWEAAGEVIRIVPRSRGGVSKSSASRLELFDAATARQRKRQSARAKKDGAVTDRGWTREDLYTRGASR